MFYNNYGKYQIKFGFNYDEFGNVTSTTVNGTPLSTNTYGVNNGPLKMSVYGNNDKITYNYNTQGLVSSIVKTDSAPAVNATNEYSWTYTSAGIEKTHTDSVNNLKYLYDYDSLGRFIRQEIQTKDTSEHVGTTEFTYDVRNNLTKYAGEFAGYTAVDKYLYSSDSGNANAESYAKDNLISRYYIANTTSRYVDYTYDGLNRLTQKSLHIGSIE